MLKKILLPFDGLKTTMPSAIYAISLAKLLNAELHILYIIGTTAFDSVKACLNKPDRQIRRYCLERTKGLFDEIRIEIKQAGLKSYELDVLFAEDITKGILDFIQKKEIGACVVQPSPYYHSELTGDLSRRISEKIKIPVLFVKTKGAFFKESTMLVPIDEKKENLANAVFAIELAKQIRGKLVFYHTTWREKEVQSEDPIKHCNPKALDCIQLAEKMAQKNGVNYELVVEMAETIEAGIIKCAVRTEADLIIMTCSTALIGGQAELVLDHSMYPLLLVQKLAK